jgi:hypothetical protein
MLKMYNVTILTPLNIIYLFSVAFQKKYDLDVDDVRIRAKLIYEASKNLSKEQKNIHRKRNKSKGSKQLQKCMGNYDEGLREIREELGVISYVCIKHYIYIL